MLGNSSSASSVQIGAADSKEDNVIDKIIDSASTQVTDKGADGDCALGCPDNAATDTVKLSVPFVKQSSSIRWVNTLNVNIREHDAEQFQHGCVYQALSCRNDFDEPQCVAWTFLNVQWTTTARFETVAHFSLVWKEMSTNQSRTAIINIAW